MLGSGACSKGPAAFIASAPDSTRVHALWSPMGRVQTPLPLRSVAAACDHLGRPLPIPRRQLTAGSGVTYLTEKN